MIRCPNCGLFIKDANIPYCPRCGRPIALDPMIQYEEEKKRRKKGRRTGRILLIISLVLMFLYVAYSLDYWFVEGQPDLATILVLPHVFCVLIGFVVNLIGAIIPRRGIALATAILYTIAGVAMILYIMFVAVQAVLCYVAFAVMKTK